MQNANAETGVQGNERAGPVLALVPRECEPPRAENAERALLGAILIDGALLARVRDIVAPEDFAAEAHRATFEAMLSLAGRSEPVDLVTVGLELEKTGQIDRAGGAVSLSALVDRVPDVENVESYARAVCEAGERRKKAAEFRRRASAIESGAPDEALQPSGASRLHVVSARELLAMRFPPVRKIVAPIIGEKTLATLYAKRGTGKTYLSLSIALAAASGGSVFGASGGRPSWHAEDPCEVLYVDGEMPAETIRERVAALCLGLDCDPGERLRFLAADLEERGVPSLASRDGQDVVERLVKPGSLLILDNLSTLFRGGGEENDAASWDSAQEFLLRLRRQRVAVLLVDHSGKNESGGPRGTSKKEDVLDLSLSLRHPENYEVEEGARFEIHFEKSRGLTGRAVESFEAALKIEDGRASWRTRGIAEEQTARMAAMRADGKSDRQIGAEMGVDHKTVGSKLRKLAARAA
jgi:Mrp family chromosome partitioning ATPase